MPRKKVASPPPEPEQLPRYRMTLLLAEGDVVSPEAFAEVLGAHREFVASGRGGGRWETVSVGDVGEAGIVLGLYQAPAVAEPRGAQAELGQKNLEALGLAGVELSWANLCGVLCRGRDLSGANLEGCLMTDSDFSRSSFRGARLRKADLSRCELVGCDLSGADLSFADLESADLSGADLTGATLLGVSFKGARLTGVVGRATDEGLKMGGMAEKPVDEPPPSASGSGAGQRARPRRPR